MNVSVPQSSRQKDLRDFVSFFLTALLGASVNFISRIFYRPYFDYETSVLFGYLTATAISFLPTKLFAFSAKDTGSTGREMIKYLLIALLALGVQVLVAKYTLEWIANPFFPSASTVVRETGSHVVGMGLSFLTNFFGHKLLTFRSTGVYDRFKSRTNR